MKTLIIDDERLARAELKRLLAAHPKVQVVGEAAHVEEALTRIHEHSPELLFLDIQMPGGSGFDLLEKLDRVPLVVFTTAYDAHAVKAFEVNALDYLLKPVEPGRLATAEEKAWARLSAVRVPVTPRLAAISSGPSYAMETSVSSWSFPRSRSSSPKAITSAFTRRDVSRCC